MAIAAVCCVSPAGPVLAAEAVSEHSESHSMQVETVPITVERHTTAPPAAIVKEADDEFGRDAGKDLSGDAALHMRASKKEASHI
jgi:hypothetical protein